MSVEFITLLVLLSLFIALFLGLPVAFSLMGVSLLFSLIFLGPETMYIAFSATFGQMIKEIYIAVPLFVFMATVLEFSGIGSDLYDAMYKWMGSLRGGLAIGTVLMCTLIAAMTGLGGTGVIIAGLLGLPEMRKRNYDKSIAVGCIPPGGALGPLIPPSVLMIIVGGMAGVSIGKLFMGGVFPGILIAALFSLYIGLRCFFRPSLAPAATSEERITWKEKLISLRGVILPILLIIAVLGGIYSGACTPSEAAGVGAFGALVCAAIHRQLKWSNLKEALFSSLRINGMVLWLLIGGAMYSAFLSASGVGHFISDVLTGLPVAPFIILGILLFISLVLGMFIDGAAITMICIPIFVPIITHLGFDLLWFCLLFVISLIVGYISPPFGMNLFYMKGIAPEDVTMGDIYRSVLPYTGLMVIGLALCLLFPTIPLWLPSMMG